MFGLNFSAGGMPKVLKNINYQNFSVLKFSFLTKIVFVNFNPLESYNGYISKILPNNCISTFYIYFCSLKILQMDKFYP